MRATQEIALAQKSHIGFFRAGNIEEATTTAKLILNSGMCPAHHGKSGDALASILTSMQMGLELGLSIMQSIRAFSVINGVPVIGSDYALALCKNSSEFEYCIETYDKETKTAICKVKIKGEPECIREFSMEDAKLAALLDKDNWRKYPKRMLQHRARGFALRDTFPHVLKGIYIKEEIEEPDYVVVNGETIENPKKYTNVADSIKNKFKPINDNVVEINSLQQETTTNIAESSLEAKSTQEEIKENISKVSTETFQSMMNVIKEHNVSEILIGTWLNRANVNDLSELTEEQAKKIIDKFNKKQKEN